MSTPKEPVPVQILENYPFHFDTSYNLLAISQSDRLIRTGMQSAEDTIAMKGKVTKIVFKIKDNLYFWELSEDNGLVGHEKEDWENYLAFDNVLKLLPLSYWDGPPPVIHELDNIRVAGGISVVDGTLKLSVVQTSFHLVTPSDVVPYYYELEIYRNTFPNPIEDPRPESPDPIPEPVQVEPESQTEQGGENSLVTDGLKDS